MFNRHPSGNVDSDTRTHVATLKRQQLEVFQKTLGDMEAQNKLLQEQAKKREKHLLHTRDKIINLVDTLEQVFIVMFFSLKLKCLRPEWLVLPITKTRLFKYIENFAPKKIKNFQIKNSDIFHISAQNIDCGYSLELPRRGGSNEYPQYVLSRNKKNNVYPCKPQFYYIKVGFKGVRII